MQPTSLLVLILLQLSSGQNFFKPINELTTKNGKYDIEQVGQALFLTPLLEKGYYRKAQKLSRVKPNIGNITSYSGFFTVNKNCESNLFFWFFPAQNVSWKEAPVLLWLQGGPGTTSMYGLFEELGPLEFDEEGLKQRQYSWNVQNNLFIIDQPVGVGYSFTGKACYPQNETSVGDDLYEAVVQFHQLFPDFQNNKFFISGQSYAGHYIPALGHAIQKNNPSAKVKINLTAMLIGETWSDPVSQCDYGTYLYEGGFIDDATRDIYKSYQDLFIQQAAEEDWVNAFDTSDALTGYLYDTNVGTLVSIYNYLTTPTEENQDWKEFIQSPEIRKALHVGDLPFQSGDTVFINLKCDIVQSVKPWIEELLEDYPIVFYNGQLDIICAYTLTISFLRSMTWSGAEQYLNATRSNWCVDQDGHRTIDSTLPHHIYNCIEFFFTQK